MHDRSLTEKIAAAGSVNVSGMFFRHAAPKRDAFAGGVGGRWGATFPVVYLGRPVDSIVVEAYRHLVEDAGVPAHLIKERIQYTVSVSATKILDLRDPSVRDAIGVTEADLLSAVNDYERCQAIAAAAHQLRYHGVVAHAASGIGETLALFKERLPHAELPIPVAQQVWSALPGDPRELKIFDGRRA